MTTSVIARPSGPSAGLRPVDPRRDMGQVADLIEVAFKGQLDPTGRRLVNEMRALGRAGWLGWVLTRAFLPAAATPRGFVWEADGRVVGNASLYKVRGNSGRWVMANVAVHPRYRRRGIARSMTEAALDYGSRMGAHSIVLQVESSNEVARALYDSMQFEALTTRSTWHRPRGTRWQKTAIAWGIRSPRKDEWREQYHLAQRTFPEGLIWPHPLEQDTFRPGLVGATNSWVLRDSERLVGTIIRRSERLLLLVDPTRQGALEADLISFALNTFPAARKTVVLEYPTGVAVEALRQLGFHEVRSLTWMSKDVARDALEQKAQTYGS